MQLQSSYTFSKSLDVLSALNTAEVAVNGGGGQRTPQDPDNIRADWGPSLFQVAHVFAGNGTYLLPWGNSLSGLPRCVLKGWEVNGIVTLRYDPCAFALPEPGTYGNVGKMTLIGPAYADFDTGLKKNFSVREGQTLAFRAEFFNLFNHPNFRVPAGNRNSVISDASGAARADAGRIIDTVGTSRQIQFGLKYTFWQLRGLHIPMSNVGMSNERCQMQLSNYPMTKLPNDQMKHWVTG